MLKIVMFMSQNPQIFIRNEIFNSRVARQGIRVVGKISELNDLHMFKYLEVGYI